MKKLFTIIFLLSFVPYSNAQQVSISKVASSASYESGATATYTISGGCDDLVNDCTGAILIDDVPPGLEVDEDNLPTIIILAGPPPGVPTAIIPTWNPMTREIIWDFTSLLEGGLPDGSSFSIDLELPIVPGSLPDGSTISNSIRLESDNDTETNAAPFTVDASPQWEIRKNVTTGAIRHDEEVTYRVQVCNTGGSTGNLNLTNTSLTDNLPNGAVFVSATGGGIHDGGMPGSVTWNIGDIDVSSNCVNRFVTVIYPVSDPNNDTGLDTPVPKSNNLQFSALPLGETTPITQEIDEVNNLLPPSFNLGSNFKSSEDNTIIPLGSNNYYTITTNNQSTVGVLDYVVTDPIPDQFSLEQVVLQNYQGTSTGLTIEVQLNGMAAWITWQTGIDPTTNPDYDASTIPGFMAGDYVSNIRFSFGDVSEDFNGEILLVVTPAHNGAVGAATDNAGNPVVLGTAYENCATISANNSVNGDPIDPVMACADLCMVEQQTRIRTSKSSAVDYVDAPPGNTTSGNPYFRGSRVQYTLGLENDGTDGNDTYLDGAQSFDDLTNPVVADLLPADVTYIADSWSLTNNSTSLTDTDVTFEQIDDFNGTGRTLLRWSFNGVVAPDESLQIIFQVTINMDMGANGTARNDYCVTTPTEDFICDGVNCGNTLDITTTSNFDIANFFNTASNSGTLIMGVNEMCCSSSSFTVVDSTAMPAITKSIIGNNTYAPTGTIQTESGVATDTVEYEVTVGNDRMANFTLPDPIFMDLFPEELDYVDGSLTLVDGSNTTGLVLDDMGTNPTIEVIRDYNSTGQTLLRLRFTGDFPIDTEVTYRIKALVQPGVIGDIGNTAAFTTNNRVYNCSGDLVDVNDLDGDGDIVETLCARTSSNINIGTVASLGAFKLVQGANDSTFLQLPNIASTNLSDTVIWRLVISNPGNVTLNNVYIVDIFPYIGDTGVRLTDQARETMWRPFLCDPIDFDPALVTLYYSTSTNPCRSEIEPFDQTGCVDDWSTSPPMDISTVQAIKLELLNPLLPAESFSIDVTMKAPDTGVTPGDIAWNSIARNADEVPAQEPNKVGVRLDVFDLAITKELADGQTESVSIGEQVDYTITLINQGNIDATDIEITDYVPADMSLVSVESGDLTTSNSETATLTNLGGNQFSVDTLSAGDTLRFNLILTVNPNPSNVVQINYLEISAASNDRGMDDMDSTPDDTNGNDAGGQPNSPADNEVEGNGMGTIGDDVAATDEDDHDPAQVIVGFDLALQKFINTSLSPGPYTAGGSVTFTIVVINQGLIDATGISVIDYIPTGMTYRSGTSGAVSTLLGNTVNITDNGDGTFALDGLLIDDEVSFDITLQIDANFNGDQLINYAEISSATNALGVTDIDSTPDSTNGNDAGGLPTSGSDNEVAGDGTGTVNSANGPTDEDDHDPALVQLQPCDNPNCFGVQVTTNNN